MANPISHLLLLPLAGDLSDADEEADGADTDAISVPSFWPPFPYLVSDSDSDSEDPFLSPLAQHAALQEASSTFVGLDFDYEGDGVDWGPPEEDLGLPLCWDCLQLEDHQRWDLDAHEAEEWEQVADAGDREEAAAAAAVRSLEWEVLLAANSLGDFEVGEDEDEEDGIDTYFLDDADEVLFGQLAAAVAEHEPLAKGGPPAARAAVESLPTVVVVAEADAAHSDMQCAVCKDAIAAGEEAKRLPCTHLYHDGCILPWLAIRNTCPLCRHELPTDDPEYEKWKARRAGTGNADADANANGSGDRYDSARLP